MSRTILITGASTGIGAAAALELAPGNELFLHYHQSRDAVERVRIEVQKRGGNAQIAKADLGEEAGCKQLFRNIAGKTDKLDALVNNAGSLIKRHPVPEIKWPLMERIFALNAFAPMLLTRLFVPLLEKGNDPSVVNITSIAMRTGAPTATLYAAAKAALDSFTRGAARELAPRIRVNAVAPGVIVTPFHDRFSTDERMSNFAAQTPLEKNGEPTHIASAIRLLIENSFVTGESIDINGGLFMR